MAVIVKSKKQKTDNDAVDGPTSQELLDNLNEGEIDTVKKYQDEVEKTRDVGTAGMGGQAASQGESRYCNSINNYDDKEFSTTNEGLIENRKEEIKDGLHFHKDYRGVNMDVWKLLMKVQGYPADTANKIKRNIQT